MITVLGSKRDDVYSVAALYKAGAKIQRKEDALVFADLRFNGGVEFVSSD